MLCWEPRKSGGKTPSISDGKGEFGADVNIWFVLVNEDHFKGTQYAKAPGVTRVDGFDCAGEEGIATVRLLFCSIDVSTTRFSDVAPFSVTVRHGWHA